MSCDDFILLFCAGGGGKSEGSVVIDDPVWLDVSGDPIEDVDGNPIEVIQ